MIPLLSAMTQKLRRARHAAARAGTGRGEARRPRLCLEVLEDRTLLTAVAAPANLVSWWTGNNTAADVMGLNNATLYNGTTYAAGKVGQALSFDGVDDRAAVADSDSLKFTASMTIEGWILVRGYSTTNHGFILFRGDSRGGLDPYTLSIETNGQLTFGIDGGNGGASVAATVPLGQLIHVAATLDDATGAMKLYENGAVVAQTFTAVRPFRDLDPTQFPGIGIGTANSTYNAGFNGLIDELSVYNRAITPGEVLGIYKAGSDGKVFSPVAVDAPPVIEGATGTTTPVTFTITRTGSLSGPLTANWATADDTAIAGTNYVAASGSVTFADGQATQTVQVTILGNNNPDPNLDFKLIVTPTGGTAVMGLATILNDDASISVGNASAIEGSNTLKFLDHFVSPGSGGLSRAKGSAFGPDGNLYVSSGDTNAILRYDPSGAFLNVFVPSGSGGLAIPGDLAFAPDGTLYVSSGSNNQVLHYDASGNFLGVTASGLSGPLGVTFDASGSNLYIANTLTNEILKYNVSSSTLSSFVSAGSGGLTNPAKAVFGPDGNLYVASTFTDQVLRYNGQTGTFIDVFATTGTTLGPKWLAFGSDGNLYTTVRDATVLTKFAIQRNNATTGAFVDSFLPARDGWSFTIGLGNIVYCSSNADNSNGGFVDRYGPSSIAAFTVSLASASAATTTVSYATADGTALAGQNYTAASGTLTFAPGETSKGILVRTLDDGVLDPTRSFTVNLSNPTGGVITSGQGLGTILDDTKFYVVDDGATDSTYQYASAGLALGNNALGGGDTAPRGVADTAAGTTTWVVDNNKTVYVYSTGGSLLGSWSAGGLGSNAQLTGIATNGTDIWLLDNNARKIYKYTGAAGLLSGSQSADSNNFITLASGNTNATDMVTDGTSIWVVNGGGNRSKVFKYPVSGSSSKSWTIDPANANPTGITINPANVSDIWIVDNITRKVYQYIGAASRTSGSQNAAATFALAPGDTNPQGIADPPPAGEMVPTVIDPISWESPRAATPDTTPLVGVPPAAAVPSLASLDAVFAMLARESHPTLGGSSIDFMSGGAGPSRLETTTTFAEHESTLAMDRGEGKPEHQMAPLTPGSRSASRSLHRASGIMDSVWIDEEGQPFAGEANS